MLGKQRLLKAASFLGIKLEGSTEMATDCQSTEQKTLEKSDLESVLTV